MSKSLLCMTPNNSCFGVHRYSAVTHHGNLSKSLVTMSSLTQLFYSGAHTGDCISRTVTQLKGRERIWRTENAEERTRKADDFV